MNTEMPLPSLEPARAQVPRLRGLGWVRGLLAVLGAQYVLLAGAFFLSPRQSYDVLAHFPPYNAHFLGDIGAFMLPLGVGLLLAARDPLRHRTLIGLAALGTLAHVLSHLRDWHLHLPPQMPLAVGLGTQVSLSLMGGVLLALYLWVRPAATARGG